MKKNIDGIIHATNLRSDLSLSARSNLAEPRGSTLRLSHWPVAVAIILVAILINSVTLLSAFEAHVINVTATIERRSNQCDALSPGYWRNHEGCSAGAGESIWASQINTLSSSFSGVFAGYSGAGICAAEWQPNCPSGATGEGKLCRAKLHTLADELNLVSGHLDPNALIAGADRGGGSFDRLGLSPSSTIAEALTAIERVIADNGIDESFITDAAQVAERLYSFYEDENPIAPQCIFELDQLGSLSVETLTDAEPQIEVLPVTVTEPVELTATSTVTTVTEATSTPPVIDPVRSSSPEAGETSNGVEEVETATSSPEVIETIVEEVDEFEIVEIEVPISEPVTETPPAVESPSEPSE